MPSLVDSRPSVNTTDVQYVAAVPIGAGDDACAREWVPMIIATLTPEEWMN